MANTFYKRPGTTDKGKDYEDFSVANLVLKLVTNKQIKNFQISSNDERFGAFDDIVLQYQKDDKQEQYALQLKHVKGKTLTLKALTEDTGNYSIKKYFNSYQQFKKNAIGYKLALITNAKFDAKDGTQIEFIDDNQRILVKAVQNEPDPIINMSRKKCYQFQIETKANFPKRDQYEEFCQNFFLYPNQDNCDQVKVKTLMKFQETFYSDSLIGEKYLQFIAQWSIREGVKEKLDRDMMRKVIAMQVLSPFVQTLVFDSVNDNVKLLGEAIDTFRVTLFDRDVLDDLRTIWGDLRNVLDDTKLVFTLCEKYQLSSKRIEKVEDLSNLEFTWLLWLMEKCPLILVDNPSFVHILELCTNLKFVLVGSQLLLKSPTFRKLSDLLDSTLYDRIAKNFKCSIQGKEEISLETLIRQNADIKNIVTTNELLLMANNRCLVGGDKEVLPSHYINRSLAKNIIDVDFLESVDSNTAIIISRFSKSDFSVKNFQVIPIDKIIGVSFKDEMSVDDFSLHKAKIYVTENELSIESAKELFASKIFHQFRMSDDGQLEWISSSRSVNGLHQYILDTYFMEERELLASCNNNVNIIGGDPGMGKSLLLSNLKNNFSSNIWTVTLLPKDIASICSRLRQSESKTDVFIDFVMNEKYSDGTRFDKKLLQSLINSGHVAFFWDALDEVSDADIRQITDLILGVSQKCYKQLITCRPHLQKILERKFKVLSVSLLQFSTLQQIVYMERRLRSSFDEDIRFNLISQIKENMDQVDHFAILSVPIQLFMLTELFLQNPDKYTTLLDGILSITDLYHYFIEESFALYFRDKANVSSPNHLLQQSLDLEKKHRIDKYEKLSLQLILEENLIQVVDHELGEFLREMEQEGDSCGFILEARGNKVEFVHNSYAEYFVANYLAKHPEVWVKLKLFIFDARFTNIRLFFDLLLAKNCPAHVAVLQKSFEGVVKHQELVQCRDLGGRTALHLACSWGVQYPVLPVTKHSNGSFLIDDTADQELPVEIESSNYIKILEFLLKRCNINDRDDLFNMNSKSYAESLNCLVTLMTMKKNLKIRLSDSYAVTCNIMYYSILAGDSAPFGLLDGAIYVKTKKGGRSLLHFAVPKNKKTCVEKLLLFYEYRKMIDGLDHFKSTTPLLLACLQGYDDIAELLLANGANPNICNSRYLTPLHVAAVNGHYDICAILIKHGARLNVPDIKEVTPLHFACESSHEQIVELLTQSGADGNVLTRERVTPLCICANKGNTKAAMCLVAGGANVNVSILDGRTPLHLAAYSGHLKIVDTLIENDANVNPVERLNGYTPLHVAASRGHLDIVNSLLKANANPNCIDKIGTTPLLVSTENGSVEIVETLLMFEANANICGKSGITPLTLACHQQHLEIVNLLLKHGGDVDFCTNDGWTPLYIACSYNNLKMVESLLKSRANPNIGDKNGLRPLHVACANGSSEIIEMLIRYQADVNPSDIRGVKPLHVAVDKELQCVVELLIRAGADIEARVKRGWKALHIACSGGFVEIIRVLIKAGTRVDSAAVEVAKLKGHEKVVGLLVEEMRRNGDSNNSCSIC